VVCNLRREHSYGRHHLVDAAAAHPPHPLRSPPSRWRLTSENRALWRVPASSLSHPFPAPTCLFQTIEVAIFGRVAGSEARWCSVAGTTGYRHVAPDQRRVPLLCNRQYISHRQHRILYAMKDRADIPLSSSRRPVRAARLRCSYVKGFITAWRPIGFSITGHGVRLCVDVPRGRWALR
jgi:hypothetical protein